MISTQRQIGAKQSLDGAALIPVETMNYSGLWLEGTITPAYLEVGVIECTRRGADLVGALIRVDDSGALSTAARAGYTFIEDFQWWEYSI
jgi:hypothetical protein